MGGDTGIWMAEYFRTQEDGQIHRGTAGHKGTQWGQGLWEVPEGPTLLGCTVRRRFSIQRSRSAKELHPKEWLCPPVMICRQGGGQGAPGGLC